ncbi:MAG: hypothetical protein WAM11_07835 [Cyanobium sp.]
MTTVRRLEGRDQPRLLEIDRQAVHGLAPSRYESAQVRTWAAQAVATACPSGGPVDDPSALVQALSRGWRLQ